MTRTSMSARLLPVLILGFALFAFLRAANIWVDFTGAVAQPEQAESSDLQTPHVEAGLARAAPLNNEAPKSAVESRIADQMLNRRETLDAREEQLATREHLLIEAEIALEKRIALLERKITEFKSLETKQAALEAQEFQALSKAYERMKPREAARIFEILEDDILVPVAAGMRTQSISSVLAEMKPEKARTLTRQLAQHADTRGAP